MQKITVVKRLQAQVIKFQITFCFQCAAQALQVKLQQLLIQKFVFNPFFDELWKVIGVGLIHIRLRDFLAQNLFGNCVEQQARGDVGVVGVLLDQRARREY